MLRNSANWPRTFGRRGAPVGCRPSRPKPEGVAAKRLWGLFIKNTGLCEPVRGRIGAEACPVPEGEGDG